jgi:hypothetical protein
MHWRDATLDVQLQELQFDWRPAELLQKRLSVSSPGGGQPALCELAQRRAARRCPTACACRWPVDIEQLQGRQHRSWRLYALPEGKVAPVVEALEATLSSDGLLHRVPHCAPVSADWR